MNTRATRPHRGLFSRERAVIFVVTLVVVALVAALMQGMRQRSSAGTVKDVSASAASVAPEDAVVWKPGHATYQVDSSGCHTSQKASAEAATPVIATKVSDGLDANKVKVINGGGVKVVEVNNIQKRGTHIDLTIDAWLANAECSQSGSAPQGQVSALAVSPWLKTALKVAVAAVVVVGITLLSLAAIEVAAAAGTGASTPLIAGCLGGAAISVIVFRLFAEGEVTTYKERVAVAAKGCIFGALHGAIQAGPLGLGLAAGVRRRLNSEEALVGRDLTTAAAQSGVKFEGLVSMVDGVAEGGLRAAQ